MSNIKRTILFTGATGYVGGSVLSRLLKHVEPDTFDIRDTFDITVLIRSAAKVKGFESLGVKVVVGSLDDLDLLKSLASESDVVFQNADADHVGATKAILKGLETKFKKTQIPPVYIHTSGTGELIDTAQGNFGGTQYSDLDVQAIEALPPTSFHRNVDLPIVEADAKGYIRSYIIMPSTIWGIADGEVAQKGLQKVNSIQVPLIISIGVARGTPMLIGTGTSVWPHVHIDDLAELYYKLFDAIISGKNTGHGREGYYFGENGQYTLAQACNAVAKSLFKFGKASQDTPVDLTLEEREKYKPSDAGLGTNCRATGDRSRLLGWKPTHTTDDFVAGIHADVEYFLKTQPA